MKLLKLHHLFLLLFIFSISQVEAQNLSFSNPKLIESADTVPVGKTYKVESFVFSSEIPLLATSNSSPYQNVQDDFILLNGINVAVRSCRMGGSHWTSVVWEQKLPIWLPSGTIIAPSTGVRYINIVEFTLNP
jgi:hypothetical protein